MSIAVTQSVVQVLEQAEAALIAELPARLATFSTALGQTLSAPACTWRSRIMPSGVYSPGVGVYDVRTVYDTPDALGAHDVIHTLGIVVLLQVPPEAPDYTAYEDARRWYCLACAQVVEAYLPDAAYGGAHGVYRVDPVETQAGPAYEVQSGDVSQWYTASQITMTARQRVWLPVPA